jgi:hypothetical protein
VAAKSATRPQAPEILKVQTRPFLLGLKVRIKELAFEAKCIRKEENKSKQLGRGCSARGKEDWAHEHRSDFWSLRHHRTGYVRPAARESLLAYAYLRGKAYRRVEASCKEPPSWDQVKRLVTKFGSAEWARGVDEWAAAQ